MPLDQTPALVMDETTRHQLPPPRPLPLLVLRLLPPSTGLPAPGPWLAFCAPLARLADRNGSTESSRGPRARGFCARTSLPMSFPTSRRRPPRRTPLFLDGPTPVGTPEARLRAGRCAPDTPLRRRPSRAGCPLVVRRNAGAERGQPPPHFPCRLRRQRCGSAALPLASPEPIRSETRESDGALTTPAAPGRCPWTPSRWGPDPQRLRRDASDDQQRHTRTVSSRRNRRATTL